MPVSPDKVRRFVEYYKAWLRAETSGEVQKFANRLDDILASANDPLSIQLIRQALRQAKLPEGFDVNFGHGGATLIRSNRSRLAQQLNSKPRQVRATITTQS